MIVNQKASIIRRANPEVMSPISLQESGESAAKRGNLIEG
jgi:hypothetical protein